MSGNMLEYAQLREDVRKHLIGYLSFDLVKSQEEVVWAFYNQRGINPISVTGLVDSMLVVLFDCDPTTSIKFFVRKSWIANLSECRATLNGLVINDLPKIVWTEQGEAASVAREIIAADGNHWRMAIVQLKKKVDVLWKRTLKDIAVLQAKKKLTNKERAKLEERHQYAKILKSKKDAGRWAIELYDLGE